MTALPKMTPCQQGATQTDPNPLVQLLSPSLVLLEDTGLTVHWSGGCAGAGDWTLGKEDAAQQVPFTTVQGTVAATKRMRNLPDSPEELHKPHMGRNAAF